MEANEYNEGYQKSYCEGIRQARRGGPEYGKNVLAWGTDKFQSEIAPAGSMICANTLCVGKTNNALDVALIASHVNENPVVVSPGATITISLLGAQKEDEEFQPIGGAVCFTSPENGISAESDQLLVRCCFGNTANFVKVKLDFAGEIGGGLIDCILSYMPR